MDDITELAILANDYACVVAYYKEKNGKQPKMGKTDMTKPKRQAHLYANVHTAKKAVDREFQKKELIKAPFGFCDIRTLFVLS